jgi:hypothetical protein
LTDKGKIQCHTTRRFVRTLATTMGGSLTAETKLRENFTSCDVRC